MANHRCRPFARASILLLAAALCGCEDRKATPTTPAAPESVKASAAAPVEAQNRHSVSKAMPSDDGKWKRTRLDKDADLWLEVQGDKRRVVIGATICLREGSYGLECLLCRRGTKEHESILSTDVNAQLIHQALLVTGAKPGSPVRYEPEFRPPSGVPIKVSVRYQNKGKTVVVPAQRWIRNGKTKKDLEYDWVFAGSLLFPNPEGQDRPQIYAANSEGGFICISNVPTALLDLPINSPKSLEERAYEPFTERLPPLDSKVEILLEPAAPPKGK
jgi:hypothetical protein